MFIVVWLFLFFFSFSFSMFFFCLVLCQAIFKHLFEIFCLFVFKENALQHNEKASSCNNSFHNHLKSNTSNFVANSSWQMAQKFFSFWLWINSKTIKTPGFYDDAHLHICSICLRLDVFSLTEIQYLQNELSEKGTHTIESMTLKIFVRETKKINIW